MKPTAGFIRLIVVLAAVFLATTPERVLAQDVYTEASQFGPFWSQSGNWSNGGVPTTGTTAILGGNGTSFVMMDFGYSGLGIGALLFQGTLGTNFELQQTSGAMVVSGSEVIGNATAGNLYLQQAGTNQAGSIIIGNLASTSSTNSSNDNYTISGGSLQVGNLTVGNNGNGSFTLVSGSVGVTSSLIIGAQATTAGDNSAFAVISGVLNLNTVGQTYVGEFGSASFLQAGGLVTGTGDSLYIGGFGGSSGSYTLVSGTLAMNLEGIGFINNATDTASFTQSGGVNNVLSVAYVAQGTPTTTGSYTLTGGTVALNSGAYFYDGASGRGIMNQSGGTLTGSNGATLVVGFGNGSNAVYKINAGAISMPGEIIGEANGTADTALFAQTGGTNEVLSSGTLEIGAAAATTGTYTLSGSGTLLGDAGSQIIVGAAGKGLFNQSGGMFTGDTLIVGNTGGSNGVYNLSGGSATVGLEVVGYSNAAGNNALFAQTGGTNSATENLVLGYQIASSGTYTLSGNGVLSLPINSEVVAGYSGAGLFQQSAGTITGTGAEVIVGGLGGSSGVYNLTGGLLSVTIEAAGAQNVAGNDAAFIQSGGTNAVLDNGDLYLGYGATSTGTYALSSGTVAIGTKSALIVGVAGAGFFNQTGGSVSSTAGVLEVSASGGSTGVYNLSGGTVSLPTEIIGLSNNASTEALFAQTGGTNNIATSGTLILNGNSGTAGTYTLGGTGLLALGGGAQMIVGGSGTGIFTQSGGVVSGSGAMLITGSGAGNGTYNLNGGSLIGSAEYVGYANAGTVAAQTAQFVQTGGTNMITPKGFLVVGFGNSTTTGTYILSGNGVLALGNGSALVLGDLLNLAGGNTGSGTFVQNGGIVSGSGAALFVGDAANFSDAGVNHYSLHGGYLLTGTENIGYFVQGNFLQDGGTNEVVNALNVSDVPGSAAGFGSYTMGGGVLLLDRGAQMQVGANQTGSVTQGGGVVSGNGATLNITAAGTYALNGGALTSSTENVGNLYTTGGAATFVQTGGTNTIVDGGQIAVGAMAGSQASYTLSGNGTLALGNAGASAIVGGSGAGTFTQSGGSVSGTTANLILGQSPSGTGTYNQSGGTLAAAVELVNDTGTGASLFAQTGGTNTISTVGHIFIGLNGTGAYTLGGNGVLVPGAAMIVGVFGNGTFTQTGGQVNGSASSIYVGDAAGSAGVYNLSNGFLAAGGEYIGYINAAADDAAFIQTGGTNFINGGELTLGYGGLTTTGTYVLSGNGVLQTSGATIYVGQVGAGVFNQSGGVVSGSGGTIILGEGSGSSGTYNLSGGLVTSSTEEIGFQNSATDNALFAQTGGTNAITPGGQLLIATNFSPTNGSYTLGGSGVLTLGNGAVMEIGNAAISQSGNAGIGTFTQNGGTVSGSGATIYVGYKSAPFAAIDTYTMNGGYLLSGTEDIGYQAEGAVTQTGGTNEIAGNGVLAITAIGGSASTGFGQYTLQANGVVNLDAGAQMKVGNDVIGAVFQSGGTVTGTAAFLRVYGFGLYSQMGGTINMGTEEIGEPSADNSQAAFTQSGGTNNILSGGQLLVGGTAGSSANYQLDAPALLALGNGSALIVSGSGGQSASFAQSAGGVVTGSGASIIIASGSGTTGSYSLNIGSVTVTSEQIGGGGTGTFMQTSGSNIVTGTLALSGSGSSYSISGNSAMTGAVESLGANTSMLESGGSNAVTTKLTVSGTYTQSGGALNTPNAAGAFTTQPGGTYVMQGFATEVGELDNFGSFQRSGGTLGGQLFNYTSVTVSGTQNLITFGSSVTNEPGATFTASANVSYTASFLNHGAYVSTGTAAQTFANLTTDATGWLAGGAGNLFTVTGGIFNSSTNKNSFNLSAAKLTISGVGTHNFGWTGANLGATTAGYVNNFAIGVFEIQSGALVNIANENGAGGLGIYVNTLLLDDGLNGISEITGNGADIFYNENAAGNAYLNNGTYALGNGGLIEPVVFVPEPGVVGLVLMGVGLIGVGMRRRKAIRA